MEAHKVGDRTWMRISSSGQCQPKKYLKKNRETAVVMLARIRDHPRASRAYAAKTGRGYVIVRIEDKTLNDQQFNETMKSVKVAIDEFLGDGEKYVD